MPPTPCYDNDAAPIQPDCLGHAGDDGTGHHAGISRWAGKGGSYRTVQRLFATVIPWATLFWVFFRHHVYRPGDVYLLVGDEVVATKAGKHTYGLDRFFASLYGKPVPGLAFFTLSLVSIAQRHSFPIRVEQVVRSDAEKAASKAKAHAKKSLGPRPKRRPGRPPGSTNTTKTHVTLTPELVRIKAMIDALLLLIMKICPLTSLVLDGHFGNHNALHMARQGGLHLISKLRCDAALYCPYVGPYAGHGPHRKYGAKVDYNHLPEQYCTGPLWRGTSRPACIRCNCSTKSLPSRCMSSSSRKHTCAPKPAPMSSCSAVTWPWPLRLLWTTRACGSKSSFTSAMPNSTGASKPS